MKSWKRYKPTDSNPWNFKRVWTLHRRAGFAATWRELQRDLSDGPEKSVNRMLSGQSRVDGIPDNYNQFVKIIGDSAVSSSRSQRIAAWWIYQMYFSPDPLRERLSLTWHNHFATSNAKVDSLKLMREQNDIFRQHAMAPFKKLLSKTIKHAAMLIWLDGDQNRVGDGNANENLARETLELFALGVGNYTEDDVKQAARALTGWSVNKYKFHVRNDWHDQKKKKILGQSGNFDGDDLIEIVSGHSATPKRLAWRLCDELISRELATEQRVSELAEFLQKKDLDVYQAVETILRSEVFYSKENIKRRIIDPEPFVIGNLRSLEVFDPPASTMILADWIEQLGRKLFYPPNVGGWPGGRAWLNSRTTVARANFGAALVKGQLRHGGRSPDFVALAKKHVHSGDLSEIASFYCQLLTGSKQEQFQKSVLKKIGKLATDRNEMLKLLVASILASPEAQLG